MTAEQVIKQLKMQPLPVEGGFYTVTHTSEDILSKQQLPSRYKSERPLSGAIYYLVTAEQFSALHKLPTDELYYYHYGDPLQLLILGPDGESEIKLLGVDLFQGEHPQILVPRKWWQGSRPLPGGSHGYSLVSTSMAPAYHQSDPVFGNREDLQSQYADQATMIKALTRQ